MSNLKQEFKELFNIIAKPIVTAIKWIFNPIPSLRNASPKTQSVVAFSITMMLFLAMMIQLPHQSFRTGEDVYLFSPETRTLIVTIAFLLFVTLWWIIRGPLWIVVSLFKVFVFIVVVGFTLGLGLAVVERIFGNDE